MAKLERIFFTTGFALLAIWGAEMLDGIVYSRGARTVRRESGVSHISNSSPALNDSTSASEIGFASWAVRRVQAYKDSLLGKADAPLAVLRIPKIHLIGR